MSAIGWETRIGPECDPACEERQEPASDEAEGWCRAGRHITWMAKPAPDGVECCRRCKADPGWLTRPIGSRGGRDER